MSKSRSKTGRSSNRRGGQFLSRKDDAIQWFQREGFDPAEFIGLLKSEKELDQARNELTQLNEYCKEEVQKVVHAHHKDFLEASRNLQDVEVLVDELRNYVSGSVAVVANLVDLPSLPKQVASSLPLVAEGANGAGQTPTAWESILALQAELVQDLQVAVAEHDVSLARALLSAGKDIIAVVDRDGAQLASQASGDGLPAWRHASEGALAAQKATLIEELQWELAQTNSSTLERRQAAQNLGLIVGPSQATQALLGCHSLRVRAAQQHLLKQHSAAGGDPDGVEYAGGLAQRTFLAIGAAAEDVRAVFPSPGAPAGGPGLNPQEPSTAGPAPPPPDGAQVAAVLPQVSALVVQWASDEARHCAVLLCRHALTPFVATGMAVGALLCVGLALVFCVGLEASHGLALRVAFMDELWPLVEAIVRRHLHRLREEASATASVDATNAALQAVAGVNGLAPLSSAALPGFVGANGFDAAAIPFPGAGGGALQDSLPDLFPRADLQPAPAVPAGLTCLPMLLPELRALAEGLAPLASRPAVAVLRQGVQAVFEALCDKVHASLARLVGSIGATTAAGAGAAAAGAAREAGASSQGGPLLAAYVSKAEKRLRAFVESDVQAALEPLSHVCGPVAPPELLVPCLAPLGELLAKLPEPAPDAAPVEPDPSSQRVTAERSQSSGLMDRIRAELEAEQGQRRRERGGWRSTDAAAAAAVAAGNAGAGAPAAAAAPPATAAALRPVDAPSEPLASPTVRVREPRQADKASAPAREAVPLEQAGDQGGFGGGQAVGNRQGRQQQQPLDAPTAVKSQRPEAGSDGGGADIDLAGQAGAAAPRRRPRPQVEPEPVPEPEPQIERQQRRGILRPPGSWASPAPQLEDALGANEFAGPVQAGRNRSSAAEPTPAAALRDIDRAEDDEPFAEPPARSRPRSRERGGRLAGRGAPTGGEPIPGDSEGEEGYAPEVRRRQVPRWRPAEDRRETTEEPASIAALQRQQRPGGLSRARNGQQLKEAEAEADLPSGGGRRTDASAPRSRQGKGRSVRFATDSAGASDTDEEDAPAARHERAKPPRAGAEAPQDPPPPPPQDVTAAPGGSRRRAATLRVDELTDDVPPPVASPGRRPLQPSDPQQRRATQPEAPSRAAASRDDEADVAAAAPPLPGRAARRSRMPGDDRQDEGEGRASESGRRLPSSDEELPQPRRARQPRFQRGLNEDEEEAVVGATAAGGAGKARRSGGERKAGLVADMARDTAAEGDAAVVGTRVATIGATRASSSAAAAPAQPGRDLPDGGDRPAAGGVSRKPNRFGIIMSDDEEEPAAAARLRRSRAAAAAAATAAANAASSSGADVEQSRSAAGGDRLASATGNATAGFQGRGGRATEAAEPPPTSRRPVRPRSESAEAEQQQEQGQQERGTLGRGALGAAAGPRTDRQPPPADVRPPSSSAVRGAQNEPPSGDGEAAGAATDGLGVATGKPQTARERLAARMAAKAAAAEGLI